MLGLNARGDEKLRSFYPTYSDDEFKSPGLQWFRCRAVQETRGRERLEVVRDFAFIIVDIPKPSFQIRPAQTAPVRNDWYNCDANPETPGCNSRASHSSSLVLVLVITSSVVFCVVFFFMVLCLAFRYRSRLFAASLQARCGIPHAGSVRRGARRPQYAESDPPREPLVVTVEPPDRRRRSQSRSSLRHPSSHIPLLALNIESLLTPPDYDAALPLPPPYDATPKEEGSCDSATGTPELKASAPEAESPETNAAPNNNSDLDNHSEDLTTTSFPDLDHAIGSAAANA